MASYVVMEPPAGSGSETVFVKDGFAFFGFLIPPLWLAWNRLWLEAIIAAILFASLDLAAGKWGAWAAALPIALSLFVGLEGSTLRLAALRRRGWREAASIEAKHMGEAEERFALGRFGLPAVEPA